MYIYKIINSFFVFLFFLFSSSSVSSQLSYTKENSLKNNKLFGYESNIAYKLPFRGNNYKFYGSVNYHFLGKAYTKCTVHNTIVEALYLSENNCPDVNFRILKGSRHKFGRFKYTKNQKVGYYCYFMTPMAKKDLPLKNYYRSGFFRPLLKYDKKGYLKNNKNIVVDYESMARFLINLNHSANIYGLEIKKVVFNRFLLKNLYKSEAGKQLKQLDIHFVKYLSEKINNRFDDQFYVEFKKTK